MARSIDAIIYLVWILMSFPLKIVGYNPLNANSIDRQTEILDEFKNFHIILLAGTGIKHDADSREFTESKVNECRFVSSGWKSSRKSNRSCGVSIAIGSSLKSVQVIGQPRELKGDLQGRGLALRIKSKRIDIAPICAYFPPQPLAAAEIMNYKSTCQQIVEWIPDSIRTYPNC